MITFKFDTSDLDRKLDDLTKRANELGKGKNITIDELLPDSFINKNSRFQTRQAMLDAGGIKSAEEFDGEPFSRFVSENTNFGNWPEMKALAVQEYIARNLFK
jgi:hypothetical protein